MKGKAIFAKGKGNFSKGKENFSKGKENFSKRKGSFYLRKRKFSLKEKAIIAKGKGKDFLMEKAVFAKGKGNFVNSKGQFFLKNWLFLKTNPQINSVMLKHWISIILENPDNAPMGLHIADQFLQRTWETCARIRVPSIETYSPVQYHIPVGFSCTSFFLC